MMTLVEKIKSIYPELTAEDFSPSIGTIVLFDEADGKGVYIKSWNHPTLTRPTEAQLEAAE
jgi:hypothetical protein